MGACLAWLALAPAFRRSARCACFRAVCRSHFLTGIPGGDRSSMLVIMTILKQMRFCVRSQMNLPPFASARHSSSGGQLIAKRQSAQNLLWRVSVGPPTPTHTGLRLFMTDPDPPDKRQPASKLSGSKRAAVLADERGVQAPLPACFERVGDGAWRKLVQDPDAVTSAWRVNHGAAKTGSDPQPISVMPPAPAAYNLPKQVLQRYPTDKLFERQERPRCVTFTRAVPASDASHLFSHLHRTRQLRRG